MASLSGLSSPPRCLLLPLKLLVPFFLHVSFALNNPIQITLEQGSSPSSLRYKYGDSATANPANTRKGYENQVGDLYLPANPIASPTPVVVLLHGGYWMEPYRRKTNNGSSMEPLAVDLQRRGYAVVNLEYRRASIYPWPSQNSGGIPGTLNDVVNGIDALLSLDLGSSHQILLDLDKIVTVGHSAGGQLALWRTLQIGLSDEERVANGLEKPILNPIAAVGLAAVTDMCAACTKGTASCKAVQEFLQARTNQKIADLSTVVSPLHMMEKAQMAAKKPLKILLVHGIDDRIVLADQSASFARQASKYSNVLAKSSLFTTFDQTTRTNEHFDAIDPKLEPWKDWVVPFLEETFRDA